MSRLTLLTMLLVLAGLLALQVSVRVGRRLRREAAWPFVQQKPLSDVEQVLYHRLVQALPQQVVLAQVPLSRFLRVRKGRPYRQWRERVDGLRVAYLVCRDDFSIVAAIELDTPPRARAPRPAADVAKKRALAAAGVPLVRWHVDALPDFDAIRAMIETVLQDRSGGTEALPVTRVEPLFGAGLHTTQVEASNDPLVYADRTRT